MQDQSRFQYRQDKVKSIYKKTLFSPKKIEINEMKKKIMEEKRQVMATTKTENK